MVSGATTGAIDRIELAFLPTADGVALCYKECFGPPPVEVVKSVAPTYT